MYFISQGTLIPKNKLQKAIQDSMKNYHHALAPQTEEELKEYFEGVLNKLNEQHSKCKPITLDKFNGLHQEDFTITFGSECSLVFYKVRGRVEGKKFIVQTQL